LSNRLLSRLRHSKGKGLTLGRQGAALAFETKRPAIGQQSIDLPVRTPSTALVAELMSGLPELPPAVMP
jgi:hypothetical protein